MSHPSLDHATSLHIVSPSNTQNPVPPSSTMNHTDITPPSTSQPPASYTDIQHPLSSPTSPSPTLFTPRTYAGYTAPQTPTLRYLISALFILLTPIAYYTPEAGTFMILAAITTLITRGKYNKIPTYIATTTCTITWIVRCITNSHNIYIAVAIQLMINIPMGIFTITGPKYWEAAPNVELWKRKYITLPNDDIENRMTEAEAPPRSAIGQSSSLSNEQIHPRPDSRVGRKWNLNATNSTKPSTHTEEQNLYAKASPISPNRTSRITEAIEEPRHSRQKSRSKESFRTRTLSSSSNTRRQSVLINTSKVS